MSDNIDDKIVDDIVKGIALIVISIGTIILRGKKDNDGK